MNQAYIITPDNQKICDFNDNNLHLIGYSEPFEGVIDLEELKKHLHIHPKLSDAIPYVTSYYAKNWGFSLSSNMFQNLQEGEYRVKIDTKKFAGELNFGELILPGESSKEIFLSTYICHPSMANNELSGPCVTTFLGKWLQEKTKNKYTYRIVFIPETIGSIAYLHENHESLKKNVIAGFNISCVGDDRSYSYIPSRNGNTLSDRVAKHILQHTSSDYRKYSWLDRGSDERQYCAPGIDLPVATICRTKYGEYPEYHTSLDNLTDVVTPSGLEGGYLALYNAIELLEQNNNYLVQTLCEPQMGKRGLYPNITASDFNIDTRTMMDFISLCDGKNDLIEIANVGQASLELVQNCQSSNSKFDNSNSELKSQQKLKKQLAFYILAAELVIYQHSHA